MKAIASKFLHSANTGVMAHRPRPRPLRAARADAGREQWPTFRADRVLTLGLTQLVRQLHCRRPICRSTTAAATCNCVSPGHISITAQSCQKQ